MTRVAVVIPYRRSSAQRAAVFEWVTARYMRRHPLASLHVVDAGGTWSKARSLNQAVRVMLADVLVMADADVTVSPEALEEAVGMISQGAPWVVPHGEVYRLSASATRLWLGDPNELVPIAAPGLDRPPYRGFAGGGMFVIARDAWNEIGGMDERFVGWGGEDVSFGHAADTLLGPHQRVEWANLWHLWHPPEARNPLRISMNHRLEARYARANGNAEAMRALIDEQARFQARTTAV